MPLYAYRRTIVVLARVHEASVPSLQHELADVVEHVLNEAKLEVMCAEYRFVWHRSGQRSFFDSNEPTVSAMQLFEENGRLDSEVLDRLGDALDGYRNMVRNATSD